MRDVGRRSLRFGRVVPAHSRVCLHYAAQLRRKLERGNEPGGVIQATDGNLYGLDLNGTTFGFGSIFDSPLSGAAGTAYTWTSNVADTGQVAQHTSGTFYGMNSSGGTSNLGTYYSFSVGLGPFVALVNSQGKTGSTVQILGQGLTGTTSVTFNGTAATSFTVSSDTFMKAVVPSGATTGPVVVTTPSQKLTSNRNFQVN